ncbi:MAG: response regulator transcription factor, partial [Vicinamibacteria bacterium]
MTPATKVFVVDDDPSLRKGLSRLLSAAGLDVESFASARAFLDRNRDQGPACLVVDQRMPELSGLQLQKMLLEREDTVSVVFLTGHGDVAMSVEAMKAGAVDFLAKPVEGKVLLEAVRGALARSAAIIDRRRDRESFLTRLALLT